MTATSTTRLGLRKVDTDVPINVVADFNDVMDAIDAGVGFESRADFPSSPFTGKCVQRSDQLDGFNHGPAKWYWDGTKWIETYDASESSLVEETTSQTRTGSTAYTAGSPVCSITKKAPASGIMVVTIGARVEATVTGLAGVSIEVRESNSGGTVVLAATDTVEVIRRTPVHIKAQFRYLLSGLTPFADYYIQTMHRVNPSTETATITYRAITVEKV